MAAPEKEEVECVVIGAGIAGLSAAAECGKLGLTGVIILEASERVGGRVREVAIECNNNEVVYVDAGAEFVHGELPLDGVLPPLREATWPNYYFLGKEALLSKEPPAELAVAESAFEDIAASEDVSDGETLLQYFARKGVASRVLDLADAVYANDYGAGASEIGLAEVQFEQRRWRHGEAYLLLERGSLSDALAALAQSLDVRTGARVVSVVSSEEEDGRRRVCCRCEDGRVFRAKAAVVAVSHAARRDLFRTQEDDVPVANGFKAFCVFSRAFWPPDFWNVVCSDSLFPEIWLSRSAQPHGSLFVLVGFAMGRRADALARRSEATVRRLFLQQLDAIFGDDAHPHPATSACVAFAAVDWASDAFARGAYTYPSPGCLPARERVGKPQDAVFFAGEAVNADLNPCLQGAMLSGINAARDVATLLSSSSSSRLSS